MDGIEPAENAWLLETSAKMYANGWRIVPCWINPTDGLPAARYGYAKGQVYSPKHPGWKAPDTLKDIFAVILDDAFLLDYDGNKADEKNVISEPELARLVGVDLGTPHQVREANNSKHWLFSLPPDFVPEEYKQSQDGRLAVGVDIKRGNQPVYIKAGKTLPFGGTFPARTQLPVAPESLLAAMRKPLNVVRVDCELAPCENSTNYGRRALEAACRKYLADCDAGRNSTLTAVAFPIFQLVAGGEVAEADAEALLTQTAEATGLGDGEISRVLANCKRDGFKQPRRLNRADPDIFEDLSTPALDVFSDEAPQQGIPKNSDDAAQPVKGKKLRAELSGVKARGLELDEVMRLANMNKAYTHVIAGGKNLVISTSKRLVNNKWQTNFNPILKQELKGAFEHVPAINGFTVTFNKDGEEVKKPGRALNIAEAWLSWPDHSFKPGGMDFFPNTKRCPDNMLNLFLGWDVVPARGVSDADIAPFLNLARDVICAGNAEHYTVLMDFFAHALQKPDEKPGYAVVLVGDKGVGKGQFMRPLEYIFGAYFLETQGVEPLIGKFNADIERKLLCFADETRITTRAQEDGCKKFITSGRMRLERKGVDAIEINNFARLVAASNRRDAVRVTESERRWFMLMVSDIVKQNTAYFAKYDAWLMTPGNIEKIAGWLLERDISAFNPFEAPHTDALKDAMLSSLNEVNTFMLEELSKPVPFECRADAEQWGKVTPETVAAAAHFPTANVGLSAGGVLCETAYQLYADYKTQNNPKDRTKGVWTRASVRMELATAFKDCGVEATGRKGSRVFYCHDFDEMRRAFCKRNGLSLALTFPGVDESQPEGGQLTGADIA